jgi:ribosomal protein S18 acetylase RimI-like enzyme
VELSLTKYSSPASYSFNNAAQLRIMEIRHIERRRDVRNLIRAHGLAWREAYEGLLPDDVLHGQSMDPNDEEVQQWMERLRENQEGVLIAVDDQETVRGFIDIRWGASETKEFVGEDEADLKAIYVEPDYWNQGVGTALLKRGLEILPESISVIRLEMFAKNDVADKFYEAKGFEQTDTGEHEIAGRSYPTAIYTLQL